MVWNIYSPCGKHGLDLVVHSLGKRMQTSWSGSGPCQVLLVNILQLVWVERGTALRYCGKVKLPKIA